MVYKIIDKVLRSAAEWQSRPLEKFYLIVYLYAMYFKVKSNFLNRKILLEIIVSSNIKKLDL